MRKFAAVLCALLLCLAAAQAGADALVVTGYDSESVSRMWENSLFFSRLQEMTGVETSAHAVTEAEEYQKLLADMEKGNVSADVLFKANLTREQEQSLADSGALIDLAPMIAENMPNLNALLEAHPEWKEIITLPDGRIVSLPLINESERQVLVWINAAWLGKLGLAMPEDMEALTQALAAIRDGDPNGNGAADEIPANLTGTFEMRWLLPYFGIVADDYHLARNEAGEIVFAPELPGYRAFIAQLADWYAQGILTDAAFTNTHVAQQLAVTSDSSKKEVPVRSGLLVSLAPYTVESIESAQDYKALLMPGPDGVIRWRDFLGEVWPGCFAVTSACGNPQDALKWVDALYSDEGAMLGYAGVEGEDFSYNAEGRWAFLVDDLRTVDSIRAGVIMYTGGTMPGITPDEFLYQVDSAVDVHVLDACAGARAVAQRVTPPYCLNAQEQEQASALAFAINPLVEAGIGRFATGETELTDETYEAWLETLRAAGSDALAALFADK